MTAHDPAAGAGLTEEQVEDAYWREAEAGNVMQDRGGYYARGWRDGYRIAAARVAAAEARVRAEDACECGGSGLYPNEVPGVGTEWVACPRCPSAEIAHYRDRAEAAERRLAEVVATVRALADLAGEAIAAVGGPHSHWREGGAGGVCRTCETANERQADFRDRLAALSDATAPEAEGGEQAMSEQVGYVRHARWGEWEAVCTVARCGWTHSRGNRTREDAEKRMQGHAAIVHPPRIPVYRPEAEDRAHADEQAIRERIAQDIETEAWERWSDESPGTADPGEQALWLHGVGCGVRFAARIARGGDR